MYKARKFAGLVEYKISHINLPVINTNGKSTLMVAISTISGNAESPDLLPYIGGINFTDDNGSLVFLNYNDIRIKTLNMMHPLQNNTHNKIWKVGIISPNPSISVSFFIDTSAPEFPDDIKLYLHVKRFCVNSMLVAINQPKVIDFGGGRFRFVNKKIAANIYDGVVAIDFGNNSSVASVTIGNQALPDLISIKRSSIVTLKLPVMHGNSQLNNIPTLCVGTDYDDNHYSRNGIKTWTGDDDEKGLQKYSAESFSGAHKFPKRALANPDAQIDLKINNLNQLDLSTLESMKAFSEPTGNSETYLLPKRLPAELFLSDFLDRVAAIEIPGGLELLGTPRYIVITYPTTYMRGEIVALRQSFAKAYLRRLNVNPNSQKDFSVFDQKNLDPNLVNQITQNNIGTISDIHDMDEVLIKNLENARIELSFNDNFFSSQNGNSKSIISAMIDEASAAAYYFIRKYVISDFGVEGFRVLHPEGCRIVVVDCGAGTTDVAAFDLNAVNNDAIKSSLDVSLAKLTGDHAFCGDFVTMQIARLIKAKMYYFSKKPQINLNNLGLNFTFPVLNFDSEVNSGSICKFVDLIVGEWKPNLNAVPFTWFQDIPGIDTKFANGTNDIKEHLLRNLIHEADRIKIDISRNFNLINNNNPLEKLSSSFLRIVSNNNPSNNLDNFGQISIYYSEINELIRGDLERLVYTVSHAMIIPSGTEEDSKIISQVLLTGKGSIYPKIIDAFREGLSLIKPDTQVKSLADIARVNNSQTDTISELKNCVSMGACWWFSDSRLGLAPLIRFRNQLENLLPFDLQVSDPNTNQLVTVFKVKTQYSEIEKPELIDFPNSVINCPNSITKVTLYRRFPGKSGEAYTLFTWINSSNIFYVSWDKNENDFVIRDANNKEGIKSRAPSSYDYFVSPLWSGKL